MISAIWRIWWFDVSEPDVEDLVVDDVSGASSTQATAFATSRTWTNGRHGVPSLDIRISWYRNAVAARSLTTRSKRCRGDAPYAVALRMNVGENVSSASAETSCSTRTLHLAYAVSGSVGSPSLLAASPDAPYTLHDDMCTKRATPAALASSASRRLPSWLMWYVTSWLSSPTGSLEISARWTTASKPSRSACSTSRTSRVMTGGRRSAL